MLNPVRLITKNQEEIDTGILPFISPPQVIVWQNRTFISNNDSPIDIPKYIECDFALCSDEAEEEISLWVRNRGFVANTKIAKTDKLPGVVRWGSRIFLLEKGREYTEAFFTIAYNLETNEPEYVRVNYDV